MIKNNLKPVLILSTIFLIGTFLRLYRLVDNTPPLYADETGQYFELQSILSGTTNVIERLISLSFSFTWFLGLTPLGVRLPSALYSSIFIILSYFFGLAISSGKKSVALVFSALIAVLPWTYMTGRIGHTHIPVMLFFACLHVLLYIRSTTIKSYVLSLVPLAIATVYYPTIIFVLPFVGIHLFAEVLKLIDKEKRTRFVLAFIAVSICFVSYVSIRSGIFNIAGRGLDLAIWRDVNTPWQTDRYRAMSWNSSPTLFSFGLSPESFGNKLVYNRVMANISTFAQNYFSFFSPDWLFFKGDSILRHSTGQVGVIYPFLIPFFLYGTFVFFSQSSKKVKQIVLIWILASPISAGLTKDGAGYLLRVVSLLPFLTYFCALGLVESFRLFKTNLRIPYGIFVGLCGVYSVYYFFFGYFHVYPSLSARSYEYGFKELSDFQVANQNAILLVIWDGYYHNNDFRFWQATPFDQVEDFKRKEVIIGDSHFNQTFSNLYFASPKTHEDLQAFVKNNKVDFIVLPDRYFVNYPPMIDEVYSTPAGVINYPDQTPALRIFLAK